MMPAFGVRPEALPAAGTHSVHDDLSSAIYRRVSGLPTFLGRSRHLLTNVFEETIGELRHRHIRFRRR